MTKEAFNKYHNIPSVNPVSEYKGKHEKQWYNVWRVIGPAGPQERFCVYGMDAVKKSILGCWDWEVTDEKGALVHV